MPPRHPTSPLFPYTTLFRSTEVTVPRGQAGPAGLTVHRSRIWKPEHVTTHDTIPVTTVARTLLDVLWFPNARAVEDRKSTRLNSSHVKISYAVFCLKKKKNK